MAGRAGRPNSGTSHVVFRTETRRLGVPNRQRIGDGTTG